MRLVHFLVVLTVLFAFETETANAETATPYPGTKVIDSGQPFAAFEKRLLSAIRKHKMGVVAHACADCGARNFFKKEIAKNRVIMIFHPRFAVPMLETFPPAGIEAPLRLYLTENKDGTARLTYRIPTSVFAPYEVPALNKMAGELDKVVANILADAMR